MRLGLSLGLFVPFSRTSRVSRSQLPERYADAMLSAMPICIQKRPILLTESPDTCSCEKPGSIPVHSQCFAGQHVLVWKRSGVDTRALDGRVAERHLVVWVVVADRFSALVSKRVVSWGSTCVFVPVAEAKAEAVDHSPQRNYFFRCLLGVASCPHTNCVCSSSFDWQSKQLLSSWLVKPPRAT